MNETDYYKRTIIHDEVSSRYLNETRTAKIFLPPGYNELITYPVIYCQDGEQFFKFGRIATHATKLILDEGIEPMIIVGVEMKKSTRTDEYWPEGNRFHLYTQFFTKELVPFVEERFPVRQDGKSRILAGDSLGGTVSLHLSLNYPDLFQKVLALSGAFFKNSQELLRKQVDLNWLDIYMIVGLQEEKVVTKEGTFNILEMNRNVKYILEEKEVRHFYNELPGEHKWGFWQNQIPDSLRYFFHG